MTGFPQLFFHALMQQDALPLIEVLWAKDSKAFRSPAVEQPAEICSPTGLITKLLIREHPPGNADLVYGFIVA